MFASSDETWTESQCHTQTKITWATIKMSFTVQIQIVILVIFNQEHTFKKLYAQTKLQSDAEIKRACECHIMPLEMIITFGG